LEVVTTANQDPLLSTSTHIIILHLVSSGADDSPRTYHWYRYLGARFLPSVQERQA
jgi:hypothetical protein